MAAAKKAPVPIDDSWDNVPEVEGEGTYGETVKLEVGGVFYGTFLKTEYDIETDNGTATAHRFADANGSPVTIWGSHDLSAKLVEVNPGQQVRVEYVKDLEMKGNKSPMKLYRVQAR